MSCQHVTPILRFMLRYRMLRVMIYQAPGIRISFGDRDTAWTPTTATLDAPFFLRQVHSNHGLIFTHEVVSTVPSGSSAGDYIVTRLIGRGIGVLTADCLPVILYDPVRAVVGIAHAGWRGSVAGVVGNMLVDMHREYRSQVRDIQVFFGPSIRVCCYRVGTELLDQVRRFDRYGAVVRHGADGTYFNLPQFNVERLRAYGIDTSKMNTQFNWCTYCQGTYHSYRRDKTDTRNMTIVTLL